MFWRQETEVDGVARSDSSPGVKRLGVLAGWVGSWDVGLGKLKGTKKSQRRAGEGSGGAKYQM